MTKTCSKAAAGRLEISRKKPMEPVIHDKKRCRSLSSFQSLQRLRSFPYKIQEQLFRYPLKEAWLNNAG